MNSRSRHEHVFGKIPTIHSCLLIFTHPVEMGGIRGFGEGKIKAPIPATTRVLVVQIGAQNGCQPPCRQPLIDYISKKSIVVYCGDYVFLEKGLMRLIKPTIFANRPYGVGGWQIVPALSFFPG